MKIVEHLSFAVAFLILLFSCSEDENLVPNVNYRQELKLQGGIEQIYTSRVTDNGFADGDVIGVFAVDYLENGNPGTLQAVGNNATNVPFTFHAKENKWTGATSIYWKDKKTQVDLYGYYPYVDEMTDVNSYPFEIKTDQKSEVGHTGKSGYEMSDFLYAKTTKLAPTTALINLQHRHIMANVVVRLLKGEGFTAEEWAAFEKVVMVENTLRHTTINLATSDIVLDKSQKASGIVAATSGDRYVAVVAPQVVAADTKLLSITIDGVSYEFKRPEKMEYFSGKSHKFTIEVNRRGPKGDFEFKLIDESISPWETDPISHNGAVREYLVANVPQCGQLELTLKKMNVDPFLVKNLKIVGELDGQDCDFIREYMPYLEALNLREVIFRSSFFYDNNSDVCEDYIIPSKAFFEMKTLKYVTLPEKLKRIGEMAFRNTILTGSLIIPEGVTHIGGNAFSNWQSYTEVSSNLTGELKLPSTLVYIGPSAFENCGFTGELRIPESVEYIGNAAFSDCRNFTGQLILPVGLKEIGRGGAFWGLNGMGGHLVIPKNIKYVEGFGPNFSSVSIPEGVTHLGYRCVTGLKGDVHLPSSIRTLSSDAFASMAIHHINLPEDLDFLETGVFNYCDLRDTFYIPPKVPYIPEYAFANNKKLEAVVIPASVERIDSWAFSGDFSLGYVRCLGTTPPVVADHSSFDGVAKDNFTVVVPPEAVEAYRQAPYWKEFKRIAAYRNFVCRPTMAKVLNAGGTRDIILNADGQWKMTYCPDWCHLSVTEGFKKTQIKLTIDPMVHGSENRSDSIKFQLLDTEQHMTYMTVSQYDYAYDEDQMIQLQSATVGNGINVFIVGDGYDAQDISEGIYLKDLRQEMEYFFGVEPYKTYRDYFNFYTGIALSYESGVGSLAVLRNTKFNTSYGNFTSDSRISTDVDGGMKYAVSTVPQLQEKLNQLLVIMIPNSNVYDGITFTWTEGAALALCPKSDNDYPFDARGVLQHEACGHGFAKLADEYIYHMQFIQKCPCVCCAHVADLMATKSMGWYENITLNGKYRNHEWSRFMTHPKYADKVELYEGGYFHSWGVYRPELNSCMNDNVPYFNAPSRMAAVKRIMEYAGEEFTFEKFVAKDKDNMGIDFSDISSRGALWRPSVTHSHNGPVMIQGSPKIK